MQKNRISFVPNQVQHCNLRTDYELIIHEFNPETCDECKNLGQYIGTDFKKDEDA